MIVDPLGTQSSMRALTQRDAQAGCFEWLGYPYYVRATLKLNGSVFTRVHLTTGPFGSANIVRQDNTPESLLGVAMQPTCILSPKHAWLRNTNRESSDWQPLR